MKHFRTLDLAKRYYQLGKEVKLPSHLKDQFLRSASSVTLNLAEGNAKSSRKDRLRIFEIAYGSFRESLVILEIESIDHPDLLEVADRLGACLYKLTKALLENEREKIL